jgi:hypothetical protein
MRSARRNIAEFGLSDMIQPQPTALFGTSEWEIRPYCRWARVVC